MFLKRLELFGFKSFADKTAFEFKPGVTLVVGPNGSGKSNVADAIRWVLGEQSAKTLRGRRMEDVIFAGSEKRKSLGMAEVSLTIDNSSGGFPLDFQEITVTRRLYRSGESEYLINKVPCRLRDIHELFMDTGIGQEGFSMIGQGRVEEVLLARPDEKRMILEDAAGIIKYRYRKKEAARKLEETARHLLRIEDLLLELRSQEGPLARQAEEAKAYKLLKEELDGLEIGMMVGEIRQAGDRLTGLEQEIKGLRAVLTDQRSGLLGAQGQEEGLRLALEGSNEALNGRQEEIYRRSLERTELENEYRNETERAAEMAGQAREQAAAAEEQQGELGELEGQRQARREQEALLAARVNRARELVSEEEAGQKAAEILAAERFREIEQGEGDHFELLRRQSELKNRAVGRREQLASAGRLRERLDENRRRLARDLEKAAGEISTLTARQVLHQAAGLRLERGIQDKTAAAADLAGKLQARQQANRALASERGQAVSRYKVLDEVEKEGQGYAQGVREILRRRSQDRLPGILGTVAQSLRVDKEYELAVEIALGGQAQHVITETERSAQDAIRWLKNYDKGRVTFLPLDTIKSRAVDERNRPRGKGVIGRLADLVDFEDRLLPAMEFILGRIWLVDELSNAVARARETGFSFRMVTLDGQVVNAGGSLTGGSARLAGSGFISRRRQLEELDREIRQMSGELSAGETAEEGLRGQWERAGLELEDLRQQKRQNDLDLAADDNHLGHSRQEELRLREEQEMLNRQQEAGEQETAGIEAILAELDRQAQDLARDIEARRQALDQLKQAGAALQSQEQERRARLTELRVQLAGDLEKLNSFEKEGSWLREKIEKTRGLIQSYRGNSALSQRRSQQHQQAAAERQRGIEALGARLEALEAARARLQAERQALQQQAASLDESQKALSGEIDKNQSRLQQLEVQEGRLQANLEEWSARLTEQYALDWRGALEKVAPIPDKRRGQQRVKEIRTAIETMPEVNLGAVGEYEKLVRRLAELTEQTEDVTRAKADLESVIREMDALVASRFKKTFDEVNEQFNTIFQRLFAGGRASLILTEPDNLLETGVDIIAQPPGKKQSHLALLSGGEKTLSAISLLMAMLRVRPSPFSIMDEIESNLDDANVDRFAGLIKEYSDGGGQFVIITHRRGTMVAGDVIYGISAQEFSGVSKVLSVRMEDA